MAEYIAKDGEERGALMLEAIALLGLMTMMSPMVVRQTADRTAEMEEVAVAGQMKTLRDALSSYIEANYAGIADEAANRRDVSMEQLRPYLPPSFFQGGNVTSKLINDYKVGIRKERPCADATNPDCTNRWKITGMVVSGNANTDGDSLGGVAGELDDRRAARIATMVGADGGYIRSSKTLSALGLGDNDAEKKKVLGAQGIWEGNVGDFVNDAGQGRIVATTTYASGVGGDFLYRHAVSGLPEANSMFTDIDMSGRGSGAHRIRHSGGLEVINGKIVVRRNRVEDFTSTNNEAVHIDKDTIKSNGASVDLNMDDIEQARIAMNRNDGILLKNRQAQLNLRAGAFLSSSTQIGISSTGSASTTIDSATDISVDAARDVDISGGNTVDVEATNKLSLTSTSGAVNIKGANGSGLDKGINLNTSYAGGNGSNYYYGLFMRSSTPTEWKGANGAKNRIVGGLNLYGSETTPFSINGKTSYRASNGDASFFAIRGSYNNRRDILLHNSTADSANSLSEGSGHGSPVDGSAADVTIRAHTPAQAVNAIESYTEDGGAIYLASQKRLRASLYSQRTGGELRLYGSPASNKNLSYIGVQLGTNIWRNDANSARGGGYLMLSPILRDAAGTQHANRMFYFNSEDGRSDMPYFTAHRITLKAEPTSKDDYGNSVRNSLKVGYSEQGALETSKVANTATDSTTFMGQTSGATTTGGSAYAGDTAEGLYYRYTVDPAFVSVMNDIKLTSRGGARLAESLPNYINKGIYVLSNTYATGPWPCDSSNCTFNIPRVKKSDGGAIVTGAWESDCDAMKQYLKGTASPSMGGSGTTQCKNYDKYVKVSYYNSSNYTQCPAGTACLTHPYLGAVPAPGRSVNDGTGVMSAYDEGSCPVGYLPVMTVTPTAIEVGKVNHIDMRIDLGGTEEDNYVYYNLENIDFSSNRASIYQPATSVSTAVQPVNASGSPVSAGDEIHGWKVALGTVSTSTSGGYYWNQGGVWQDSMKAVAHTYCYFNPSRFVYPNMVIKNNVMKAMDAPRLTN